MPALMLAVEPGEDLGAFRGDAGLGLDAPLHQPLNALVHSVIPRR
jgi:hypothetical protein